MTNIVFDIGGTKMRVARVIDHESFEEPLVVSTPQVGEEGVSLLAEIALKVANGQTIGKIAGGVAAVFEGNSSIIANSSNLKGWEGLDLGRELSRHISAELLVDNDASVVGLGEAHFGAGKGERIVVYVTVSTGVGGSRIVNGEIALSSFGFEPGHQILDTKTSDTLESLVSGRALEKLYNIAPYEIKDPEVWERVARDLAVGLHNTILHWSPSVVVLGGPMMVGDPAIPIKSVIKHLDRTMKIFKVTPEIRLATLKDFGGLYGGLVLLK